MRRKVVTLLASLTLIFTFSVSSVYALNPQPLPPGLMHGYMTLVCPTTGIEAPPDPCRTHSHGVLSPTLSSSQEGAYSLSLSFEPPDPCGKVTTSALDGSSKDPARIHYQDVIFTHGTVCKNQETQTYSFDLFYQNSENLDSTYELKGTYTPEYKDGDNLTNRHGTFVGALNPQPLPPGMK